MMNRRAKMGIVVAGLLLGLTGMAAADHYPAVPGGVRRKDRNVLQGIGRLMYGYTDDLPLAEGECNCLELSCDAGSAMLSCGGEMDPYNSGAITGSRQTSPNSCWVCGCAWSAGVLHASPVCLGF